MYLVLVLTALAWPWIAAVAAAFVIWWLARIGGGPDSPAASGPLSRWGWLLSAGAAAGAVASYGYGVNRTTSLLMTDAVARCASVRPDLYGLEDPPHFGGSQSLWPLHDTTCGPELVPAFVNPLVVALAALSVAFAAWTCAARMSMARKASAGHRPD